MPKNTLPFSEEHLIDLFETAKKLALEAGKVILDYYHSSSPIKTIQKEDGSPLTIADLDAHHLISKALTNKYKYFVLSEESDHESIPLELTTYWLIDPLDGTKDFIARTDDFTVNIALIHNQRPILGVIYAPVLKKLYAACPLLQKAYMIDEHQNKKDLKVRGFQEDSTLIYVSRFHKKTFLEDVRKKWPALTFKPVGSSLKFCFIAEGLGDLYIRRGSISTWDSAAGECIVMAAGGYVLTIDKELLIYDHRHLSNKSLLCFASTKTAELFFKYSSKTS